MEELHKRTNDLLRITDHFQSTIMFEANKESFFSLGLVEKYKDAPLVMTYRAQHIMKNL